MELVYIEQFKVTFWSRIIRDDRKFLNLCQLESYYILLIFTWSTVSLHDAILLQYCMYYVSPRTRYDYSYTVIYRRRNPLMSHIWLVCPVAPDVIVCYCNKDLNNYLFCLLNFYSSPFFALEIVGRQYFPVFMRLSM